MRLALVFVASLLVAACSRGDERPPRDWSLLAAKRPDAFPVALDQLKVTNLYRIDPFATWNDPPPGTPMFHEWVIAASGAPRNAESGEALRRSMRVIVDTPEEDDSARACFEPHHGVRFSDGRRTYDVVICFHCSNYAVYSPEGKLVWGGEFTTAASEEPNWKRIFREALPL